MSAAIAIAHRPVTSLGESPDMFDLRDTLAAAEQDIAELLDNERPLLDDAALEQLMIRSTLADGRAIVAVRLERVPHSLEFRVILLTGDDL